MLEDSINTRLTIPPIKIMFMMVIPINHYVHQEATLIYIHVHLEAAWFSCYTIDESLPTIGMIKKTTRYQRVRESLGEEVVSLLLSMLLIRCSGLRGRKIFRG